MRQDIAEIEINDIENDWYYGTIITNRFDEAEKKALAWYDEVVTGQMLSYVDEALLAVEKLGFNVRFSNDKCARIHSVHLSGERTIVFRIKPVNQNPDGLKGRN